MPEAVARRPYLFLPAGMVASRPVLVSPFAKRGGMTEAERWALADMHDVVAQVITEGIAPATRPWWINPVSLVITPVDRPAWTWIQRQLHDRAAAGVVVPAPPASKSLMADGCGPVPGETDASA